MMPCKILHCLQCPFVTVACAVLSMLALPCHQYPVLPSKECLFYSSMYLYSKPMWVFPIHLIQTTSANPLKSSNKAFLSNSEMLGVISHLGNGTFSSCAFFLWLFSINNSSTDRAFLQLPCSCLTILSDLSHKCSAIKKGTAMAINRYRVMILPFTRILEKCGSSCSCTIHSCLIHQRFLQQPMHWLRWRASGHIHYAPNPKKASVKRRYTLPRNLATINQK